MNGLNPQSDTIAYYCKPCHAPLQYSQIIAIFSNLTSKRNRPFIPAIAALLIIGAAGWHAFPLETTRTHPRIPQPQNEATAALPKPSNDPEGAKMTIYQNSYGYEISYPADWHTLGLPDMHGDQRRGDAHYYLSPRPISKQLQQSLSTPVERDYGDPDGYPEPFQNSQSAHPAIIHILAQQFDPGTDMPNIFAHPQDKGAPTQQIQLADGTNGALYIDSTRGTNIIIIDNERRNIRYLIEVRNPRAYGLSFAENIMPILSTFRSAE